MGLLQALKVFEPRVKEPWTTLEKRLQCPHCHGSVYVSYPWNATAERRLQLTREGIEEHRKLCTKADAQAARVYEISYPRG